MYILIDIGGTKTRLTLTEHREAFLPPVVFETPQEFDEWLRIIKAEASPLHNGRKIQGVIVGVPGTFSTDGHIICATNLPNWNGIALRDALQELFSCNVVIENDAALVGLGEATFGAGKGHPIVAYITISTGVGGARIVDGKIDRSTFGFEIGHTIIERNTDVESLIGGGALEKRFGKPSKEVHDIHVWEKINHYAGIFGANTAMYWSPSILVYGGPVMNDLHIEIIEKEAKEHLKMFNTPPLFVRATLKDFGGLYGALAKSKEL
jgi:glucokinase